MRHEVKVGMNALRRHFWARCFAFLLHRFLLLTSFPIYFASYFLVPLPASAQTRYHTLSSVNIPVVSPDTINFGRVRVGEHRDSIFSIRNSGTSNIDLNSLDFSTGLNPEFSADSIAGDPKPPFILQRPPGTDLVDIGVHFAPTHVGRDTGSIPIYWEGDSGIARPAVVLLGSGVAPTVISIGHDFGSVRDSLLSALDTLSILNIGSNTTAIDSVTIVDTSALSDFAVWLDSLPPFGARVSPLPIGYEGSDTAFHFIAQFQPKSLGRKMLVVRIHTIDSETIFDTLWGTGVEPQALINPRIIDFGTITLQRGNAQSLLLDSSFVISNAAGTYPARLDSVIHRDTNFAVQWNPAITFPDTLKSGDSLTALVNFNIVKTGDFADTLYFPNDTRYSIYPDLSNYQPMIILKAKVRTGSIGSFNVSFDTVTTCDTSYQEVAIFNPFPIEVSIDSIVFVSDTAGFSYNRSSFKFPINIPPNGTYSTLQLAYSFPLDSLNGPQALKMALFQHGLDNEAPVVDTATASVVRKQQVLTLQAKIPPAGSLGMSAADDVELRLPIMLEGPHSGVTELDSWTLSLQFSNDLFVPTSVDTSGSLSVAGDPSYTLKPYWDQSSRTYSIVATGTAVSDPARMANNLLLTVMLQAYLTTDTVVTVTPTFTCSTRPCALNIQTDTLSIPYADDCGDQTIRAMLLGDTPSFILTGTWPNPVRISDLAGQVGGVTIGYSAAQPCNVTATIFSASGEEIGNIETSVQQGSGTISVPEQLIPDSGPAFIRVQAFGPQGNLTATQTCKFAVIR